MEDNDLRQTLEIIFLLRGPSVEIWLLILYPKWSASMAFDR